MGGLVLDRSSMRPNFELWESNYLVDASELGSGKHLPGTLYFSCANDQECQVWAILGRFGIVFGP